jgi:perosamine synthetase
VKTEVPPTAGVQLQWRDLWPTASGSFAPGIAEFLGLPEVQIECSGTAALVVALTALREMSARRTVIMPAYTCPLVPLAAAHCGLRVILCDLAPASFDMDYGQLDTLCDDDTLAVLPTHLAGRVANVAGAVACARRAGAWVIEDAAQALGARFETQCVGDRGDIGFFSLAVGKGLTIYEGGVLYAHDPALRARLREVSSRIIPSSYLRECGRVLQLLGYAALYRPRGLRIAYGAPLRRALRSHDLLAAVGDYVPSSIPLHRVGRWRNAVGASALQRLAPFQAQLVIQAERRIAQLAHIPGVQVLRDPPDARGVWPCLLILMPSEAARDAALERLWTAGLGVSRLFIHALPDYEFLQAVVPSTPVPRAREFASRTLTISNSPLLGEPQFESICAVLRQITPSWPSPAERVSAASAR